MDLYLILDWAILTHTLVWSKPITQVWPSQFMFYNFYMYQHTWFKWIVIVRFSNLLISSEGNWAIWFIFIGDIYRYLYLCIYRYIEVDLKVDSTGFIRV